ncbi:hypothetical protein HBB16_09610 [Pseudonocardia sp. MCCB 268]|nr:hypothetical protein [Pseudonocardia cytotoxica]
MKSSAAYGVAGAAGPVPRGPGHLGVRADASVTRDDWHRLADKVEMRLTRVRIDLRDEPAALPLQPADPDDA